MPSYGYEALHGPVVNHQAQLCHWHCKHGLGSSDAQIARERQLHPESHACPRNRSDSRKLKARKVIEHEPQRPCELQILKFFQIGSAAELVFGSCEDQHTHEALLMISPGPNDCLMQLIECLVVERVASLRSRDCDASNPLLAVITQAHPGAPG